MMWFVTGVLRAEDHWAFDRTVEGTSTTLEFFVAPDYEQEFLARMAYFQKEGLILCLEKLPNRFIKKEQ